MHGCGDFVCCEVGIYAITAQQEQVARTKLDGGEGGGLLIGLIADLTEDEVALDEVGAGGGVELAYVEAGEGVRARPRWNSAWSEVSLPSCTSRRTRSWSSVSRISSLSE